MKKEYFSILIVLLSSFLVYSFIFPENLTKLVSPHSNPSPSTVNNISNKFLLGAMNDFSDRRNDYVNNDSVGFNTVHKYVTDIKVGARTYPMGLTTNDLVTNDISLYASAVRDSLAEMYTNGQRKMILHRPKITWLCYGQSSIYECEPVSTSNDLWFYSFNDHDKGTTHTDNTQWGNGISVMKCQAGTDNAGFVVKRLKANTEQCNASSGYSGDEESNWLVKPKIRIDSIYAANIANQNTKILRVDVYNQKGYRLNYPDSNRVVSVDISVKDLKPVSGNNYSGKYMSEFYFNNASDTSAIAFQRALGDNYSGSARGTCIDTNDISCREYNSINKADIRVYWYGNCDMWIDYVKVENDVADELFSGLWDPQIEEEVDQIGLYTAGGSEPIGLKFYIEIAEFNNVPCMAYVNQKLKTYSSPDTVDLMQDFTYTLFSHVPWRNKDLVSNAGWLARNYIDRVGFTQIFAESYPLTSGYNDPISTVSCFSRIPNSLPNHVSASGNNILADDIEPDAYDDWLEFNMNYTPSLVEEAGETSEKYMDSNSTCHVKMDQNEGGFRYVMKTCNEISKLANVPFIFMPQAHHWFWPGEARREPTNEELDMMTNTAISYGAKGFIYFWYPSMDDSSGCVRRMGKGVAEENGSLRTTNFYGQTKHKWQTIADISTRVKKWEGAIMGFSDSLTNSFIINESAMKTKLIDSTGSYFTDVMTFKTESSSCYDAGSPASTYLECVEERYVQVSTFKNPSETDVQYFMIVNRRCAPINNVSKPDGRRFIRLKFDSDGFSHFNNWKIIDIEKDSVIKTFNKSASGNIDLGWFNPGQGKLYKIVPVMKTGGTFVCNEYVRDISFNCIDMVNASSYDLTLKGNMVISFPDTAGISMGNGKFYCGVDSTPSLSSVTGLHLVNLNSKWQGVVFGGPSEVIINNTEIKEVNAVSSINNGYSLTIQNPVKVRISKSKFTNSATDSSGAGAINVQYLNTISSPSIDILDNEINVGGNSYDAVTINAYSGMTLSPYVRWNRITKTSSGGGGIGIALLSLTGGTIRNNTITNAKYGMYVYHSTVNLWRNNLTSSVTAARNLWALGISTLNMQPSAGTFLGGENTLSNTTDSRCIHIEDAYFNINEGYNNFKLTNASERHLYGYMPISDTIRINAIKNCFSIDNTNITDTTNIRKYVIWGNATKALFNFYGFSCGLDDPAGCYTTSLDGDIRDTTWNNCDISMNENDSGRLMAGGKSDNPGYEKLYDDINLNIQKRELEDGEDNCKTLLEQFTDSVQTLDVVGKLFYCVTAQNPNETELTALKSYYETFILNHAENTELTAQMFYYIQKTKAKLGEYESAIQGFETIMSQFPTTYMGLLARWDYMATHLLDSLSGQGGGMKDHETEYTVEQEQERLMNLIEDPKDKYDKKKFTKEDRKVIVNNVVKSFTTKKDIEIKKVKSLEEKVTKNIATSDEKNELKKVNKLKEIVKPQRVNTLIEHVNVIRNDVRQFADLSSEKDDNAGKTTAIPLQYKLNQNYPNPFNPTTKINYELKNAGYVSLKIYDLLGREIAELVNETKDAGRYTIDFNASKYMMASGIYFYRIKAGEFVDTKRMVLVK